MTRRGLRASSGRCLCSVRHTDFPASGRSRPTAANIVVQYFLKSGPEDYAFERNSTRLGADLGSVESIILSHGHWDHAGAMFLALGAIRARNGGRRGAVLMRIPPCSIRAGSSFRTAAYGLINMSPPSMNSQRRARVICTTEPQVLLDDMFFVSGETPRVTPFERGLPGQVRRTADGKGWEPDELVIDERWLAVHVAGKGLVVFSACSHAGIVNVLKHAHATFPRSLSMLSWEAFICPALTRRSSRRRPRRCGNLTSRR